MARTLTVTDAYAIMNALVKEATGQESTLQTENLSGYISAGETVLAQGKENTLNALSMVLARTIVAIRPYKAQFNLIQTEDAGTYSNRVRKISFMGKESQATGWYNTNLNPRNLYNGRDNTGSSTSGAEAVGTMWEQNKPVPYEVNFGGSYAWDKSITVYEDQIDMAFRDPSEMARFANGIMERFRNGEIKILCNAELFGEGLDIPDCECVVLLRPTQSLSLYIQQSMRSMRYQPNKTAIIIDHVGNCYLHGLPDDDREWSLENKKKQENTVKIRECVNCFAVYPPTLKKCPYCNFEAVKEIRTSEREVVEVDLVELKRQEDIKNTRLADADLKTWSEIVEFQKLHNYKFAWCIRYAVKNGVPIPKKYSYMRRVIGV